MKWILFVIALFFPLYASATDGVNTVGHPAKVNSVTTPDKVNSVSGLSTDPLDDVVYWNTLEAANMGTGDCSAGDTTGAITGTPVFQESSKYLGTNGMQINALEHIAFVVSSGDILPTGGGIISHWVRFVAQDITEYTGWRYAGSASDYIQIIQRGDFTANNGELEMGWNDGTNEHATGISTDCDLSEDTWYLIAPWYDPTTTDDYGFKVYNTSLGLECELDKTDGAMISLSGGNKLFLGQVGGMDTLVIDIDNFAVSDDYTRDPTDYANTDDYPGAYGGCSAP